MREGLHTAVDRARAAVTHPVNTISTVGGEAARAARSTAHEVAHLAGRGARVVGGAAEDVLAKVGLVGREDATDLAWDPEEVEREAAEAVARQDARAAAESAEQVKRVAAIAEEKAREDEGPRTPSGIPAADEGYNPDTGETDLVQPDTADPADEGTLHAVESESETLRRAARRDKS